LIELFKKNVTHLTGRQLAITVETQRLNFAVIVLVDFNLVLDNLNSCFEDTFVLKRLPHLDLLGLEWP
jgi:hypothetical protein